MYLPKANYAVYTHKGPYDKLESFYNAILQQIPKGYDLSEGLILERYLNSIAGPISIRLNFMYPKP